MRIVMKAVSRAGRCRVCRRRCVAAHRLADGRPRARGAARALSRRARADGESSTGERSELDAIDRARRRRSIACARAASRSSADRARAPVVGRRRATQRARSAAERATRSAARQQRRRRRADAERQARDRAVVGLRLFVGQPRVDRGLHDPAGAARRHHRRRRGGSAHVFDELQRALWRDAAVRDGAARVVLASAATRRARASILTDSSEDELVQLERRRARRLRARHALPVPAPQAHVAVYRRQLALQGRERHGSVRARDAVDAGRRPAVLGRTCRRAPVSAA